MDTHFATEEAAMISAGYPKYFGHRSEHARFTGNLKDLKHLLLKDGPGVHIVILTNHLVVDWLRSHILSLDKAFGNYLRSRP